MTAKFDKVNSDVMTSLSDEVGGRRETEKRAIAADKVMREMVTQYHTKVLTELDKINKVLEVMRSTPVEIIATQEMRNQAIHPFVDGATVQGHRTLTPTIQHAGTPPPFIAVTSPLRSSPSREVQQHMQQLQQQNPMFERPYFHPLPTSSPNREVQQHIQQHQQPNPRFERPYLNQSHYNAWNNAPCTPNSGESGGMSITPLRTQFLISNTSFLCLEKHGTQTQFRLMWSCGEFMKVETSCPAIMGRGVTSATMKLIRMVYHHNFGIRVVCRRIHQDRSCGHPFPHNLRKLR